MQRSTKHSKCCRESSELVIEIIIGLFNAVMKDVNDDFYQNRVGPTQRGHLRTKFGRRLGADMTVTALPG